MRQPALLALLAMATLMVFACSPEHAPDGDGDVDGDVDGDGDTDADADEDVFVCDPTWDCCYDTECSDGIYCNGLEVCDRGRCDPGVPIDCDDGRACTDDACDEMANLCHHAPNHDLCDDGDLCNGTERCEPPDADSNEAGCVLGMPQICDDGDNCTEDYCEESECLVRIRDNDDDGHADQDCSLCVGEICEEGDDCDDNDAEVFPGNIEVCDDGKDNNCDRDTDYADPSCIVPNDTCGTALELVPDALIFSSLRGTTGSIASGCAPASDRDVAFYFTISAVQDVEIAVDTIYGGRDITLALTAVCDSAASDLTCTTGRTFTQISRSLAAGTYYVVASATAEVDFTIELTHYDPLPRPDGDQCATATVVTEGSWPGTTIGFDPDYDATCGDVTDLDATFEITVTETSSMNLTVTGSDRLAVAVQSSCGVPSTEAACFEGLPATGWVPHLAPGTHYIIVKTPLGDDFLIDIELLPAAADGCTDVGDISAGGTYMGTTAGMAADITTSCGEETGPDSAYYFTLTRAQDVTVDFRSPTEDQTLSLTTVCGDPGSELRCSEGRDFQLRGRGLGAGTYYLVATADAGADYEFDIGFTDPVPRPPADLCSGAIDVTGGGTFAGTTTDCENDYEARCGDTLDLDVTYQFTLTEARSMDIDATAAAGSIAVAVQGTCGVLGTEEACTSGTPTTSRHVRHLDPGTWYLIFKTPAATTFDFTLTFGPPEIGLDYVGYADWSQNVSTHDDAAQDALMDAACETAFPGSFAATVEEIVDRAITGLPATNGSGRYLVPKCPRCEGRSGWTGALSGHCRNCINPGNAFPATYPPGTAWNDYCCSSTRSTVCVR